MFDLLSLKLNQTNLVIFLYRYPHQHIKSNLLLKIMLKVMARKAGVSKLDLNHRKLTLHFSEAHQQNPSGMIDMIVADPSRFELTPEQKRQLIAFLQALTDQAFIHQALEQARPIP